ncbi:MAG TPA: hypothetical protein VJ810_34290 [Blastocatellia bacterium]|nr:hypothetical protein [Blastocatellia bacterium]
MKILFPALLVLTILSGSYVDSGVLTPQAQQKPVKVPGTKVSIIPPSGLTPSEQFPGFGDEATMSSILITELPAPYTVFAKGFTEEALATKGMRLLTRKEISLDGRPGILMHLSQEAQGLAFLKWMVVTGNEKETALITATFLEEKKSRWNSEMEKSVLSVQWEGEAKIDPLAGLNFSYNDDQSLKFARRITNMVILTKDGAMPGKPTNDPFFIIGSSISGAEIPDVKKFAEGRLMQIEQVSAAVIKNHSDVTLAGLPGSEIIAEAQWKDSPDAKMMVYQVLLIDEKNYFIMQGFAPQEEREKYLAIFNRIAQSFRKK